jgi:actin-related protein
MYSQDLSTAVIDMGSLTTRVGYAGEDTPKFVCPTFVGNVVQTM